jgi:SAM-dependent methyltransferase
VAWQIVTIDMDTMFAFLVSGAGGVTASALRCKQQHARLSNTGRWYMETVLEEPGLDGRPEHASAAVAAVPDPQVEYLRQVALAGKGYKEMSYELLHLRPGQQVLSAGCGVGDDLLDLADRVGETGRVVGLCPDWEVWRAAQAATAERPNIQVGVGQLEFLGFAEGVRFHRVRADWVLQDVSQPWVAVAKLWHVVAPGGLLELVEPDWNALMLFPAASAGGSHYHTLHAVMAWQQRLVRHPLMGRQLPGLLHQQTQREAIAFNVGSLEWTDWQEADTILRLSVAARALAQAQPAWKSEIDAWLKSVEAATRHGEFLANLPVVFARAWKERYVPLAGR